MHSLTDKFNELRQRLKAGISSMKHTGFDPVYYVVFPSDEIIQAKLALPQFLAQLRLDGFKPSTLSLSKLLNDWFSLVILINHPFQLMQKKLKRIALKLIFLLPFYGTNRHLVDFRAVLD